ncbi:hypothetical protein K439DRAFT_1260295, partial [Ramaria rubella]
LNMASDSNDCPTLVDATVFQIWKIRITAELRDKKVWGLVDGSEVNTGPNVTIYPSYYQGTDSWEVRDGKAHSTIVKYMSNLLIFKHVTSPQTLKELWESVISQFENQNTGISAFYTYVEMMNIKWDGSSNITEHISKIRAAEKKL